MNFKEISEELLDRGSRLHFKAHGSSMHPFIKDGSILITEPLQGNALRIGDIILCHSSADENAFVAHRLIKIDTKKDSTNFLTKGDDLRYYDPPVTGQQVLGRVVQIERKKMCLKLTDRPWCAFGPLIAFFARGRYFNQSRVVRNLGRLWWLLGGKRIK